MHFYQETFYKCRGCKSVYRDAQYFLNDQQEKARYDTHNNDILDVGYQRFVSPITTRVERDFEIHVKGLDYGAGPGPVISHILSEKGYQLALYDPYYHPDTSVLQARYDFIVCCEVIEHFHHPDREFEKLFSLLKNTGRLYLMTEIFHEGRDFKNWYYKNDPTHVFFYHREAFEYIAKKYHARLVEIDERCIVFEKS
ncbi:class I SAM-dependent methyltransferase [Candidatus Gracilibacteria bacterium]|nr:class I SAM-dependent methyltransferase [Candidatus Gracilibacteria bacterium]